ncbi:MAG: FAD-dependent oxidoreductase [Deltaproteobacteria bacterium]|nr:FAD-dependent oxidoreductase [Deltaproteobacteria bacterium]
METISTRCCVAGGGPAGMMLGFLLARAGVDVVVFEKHVDFLRDFRGDTIHPSTLEIMHELGMLDDFLRLPHQKARVLGAQFGDTAMTFADFTRLPVHCKFLAFMPQWDFLNFIAQRAASYPSFHLRMSAEVTDLVEEAGRIAGARVTTSNGPFEVRADLVVGADGRGSLVREKAGLKVKEFGAPMDVLWLRLRRTPGDPEETAGHIDVGRIFIMINRGNEWQLGFVIPKGTSEQVREQGLPAFRETIITLAPLLRDRVSDLRDWNEVKLLTVRVDRLSQWYRSGLLCIGDASHAMSPVGGIGINLAIQDAVAAANILAAPLREGRVADSDLRQVQERRALPTRLTQSFQLAIQNRVIKHTLERRSLNSETKKSAPPLMLRIVRRFPAIQRLNARLIGLGFRPEHVRT